MVEGGPEGSEAAIITELKTMQATCDWIRGAFAPNAQVMRPPGRIFTSHETVAKVGAFSLWEKQTKTLFGNVSFPGRRRSPGRQNTLGTARNRDIRCTSCVMIEVTYANSRYFHSHLKIINEITNCKIVTAGSQTVGRKMGFGRAKLLRSQRNWSYS